MTITEFSNGHSGCTVSLYQGAETFVRKTRGDQYDRQRFHNQMTRQSYSCLPHPKILARGLDYFDMEYIHGLDIRTFLEHADHEMIDAFVDELCDILDLLSDRKYDMIDSSVFENKIRTITSGDPYIEKWLLERDWHAFPDTESHGDMTFENMIVGGDGIVFIDFLDGISSYQLDYAKILQDARCYWFMRDRPSKNIAIKCDYIAQQLKEEYDTGRDDQLVVFHLYRILPYCRREKDTKFVIEAIDRIIQ